MRRAPSRLGMWALVGLGVVGATFSVMVLLYSVLNPIRKGPTDVDQPRGRGRRSLIR